VVDDHHESRPGGARGAVERTGGEVRVGDIVGCLEKVDEFVEDVRDGVSVRTIIFLSKLVCAGSVYLEGDLPRNMTRRSPFEIMVWRVGHWDMVSLLPGA